MHYFFFIGFETGEAVELDGGLRLEGPEPEGAFAAGFEPQERVPGNDLVRADPDHHLVRVGPLRGVERVGRKDSTG